MKKIVIHCAAGLQNIGDEALLKSFLDVFALDNEVYVLCINAKYAEEITGYDKCIDDVDNRCKKIIRECDMFILGGGGLFQDETSIYNVYRWGRYLEFAIKHKKKTMIYSNSIGPLNRFVSKKYVARILKKTDIITLRDSESQNELKKIGVGHAKVTADGVFGLKKNESVDGYKYDKDYICVIVRHWFDTIPFIPVSICKKFNIRTKTNKKRYDCFINNMAESIDKMYSEFEYDILLLPFMRERDFRVSKDIKEKVCNANTMIVPDEFFGINSYRQIINNSKLVVGMRLHSIIFAIIEHVPFVALSYSKKVSSLVGDLGFERQMMDVYEFQVDSFMEKVKQVLEQEEEIIKKEKEISLLMQREEKRNEIYLKKCLNS